MKSIQCIFICLAVALFNPVDAFTTVKPPQTLFTSHAQKTSNTISSSTQLQLADLDTVALVAGQENYGFAIVALSEGIWSFAQAPSLSHAKVLAPAVIAAIVLFAVSGPLITSGNVDSVSLGLEISTIVSLLLGGSYVARMAAPYSPSPKEAAFGGLLIAIAGFFSFSQNLVVDGFVSLPSLPSIPLPELQLGLGDFADTDRSPEAIQEIQKLTEEVPKAQEVVQEIQQITEEIPISQ